MVSIRGASRRYSTTGVLTFTAEDERGKSFAKTVAEPRQGRRVWNFEKSTWKIKFSVWESEKSTWKIKLSTEEFQKSTGKIRFSTEEFEKSTEKTNFSTE